MFVDCFTYNAHTTAVDSLWGGLPVSLVSFMCVCVCVCVCVCEYRCVCIYLHICTYLYVCRYMSYMNMYVCIYKCMYSHTYTYHGRGRGLVRWPACLHLSHPCYRVYAYVCPFLRVSCLSVCLSVFLSLCVFLYLHTHFLSLSLSHTYSPTHSLTRTPGDDDARAQHEHAPGGGGAFLLRPGLGDLRQVLIFVSVCICVMCVRMYSYDIWFLGFRVGINVTEDYK